MKQESLTVFYAEDDEEDQMIFREAISHLDNSLKLHIQKNGQELIDKLHQPPPAPDVVFLDLNMPGKNGLQTLREIRESEKLKDTPVVIFTTSSDAESIEKTKELGASLFVTKPSMFNQLAVVLADVLAIDWNAQSSRNRPFVMSVS
jgi:CheY-like chemotaxis protein